MGEKDVTDGVAIQTNPLSRVAGADTLKMVVIMHRHGARFPNHSVPGDLNWPADPGFWETYSAQLTPTGSHQHVVLGGKMSARYVKGTSLFDGLSPSEIGTVVQAHTSNLQRTLFSAWSFLAGMFPETPRHFSYLVDREEIDLEAIDLQMQANGGGGRGIEINVEDGGAGKKSDELFHQMDINPQARQFLAENHMKCDHIQALIKDPKAVELVRCVSGRRFGPNPPIISRHFRRFLY